MGFQLGSAVLELSWAIDEKGAKGASANNMYLGNSKCAAKD